MKPYKFPGAMFYDNGTIEAIHADWPVYPIGHGIDLALENLSYFDLNTRFYVKDDIDKALLFVDKAPSEEKAHTYFYLSLWHEDLINLWKEGLIINIQPLTEYQYHKKKFDEIVHLSKDPKFDQKGHLLIKHKDGLTLTYNKPTEQEGTNLSYDFAAVPKGYIELTERGKQLILNQHMVITFDKEINSRIEPLLNIEYFDSAVREAAILLETKIKGYHEKNDLYGWKLINCHYNFLIKKLGYESAYLKCYRNELRTAFTFIRNPYAHNFLITSRNQALFLIKRINQLLVTFNELIKS
jgi:hypothetical protein